MTVPTLRLNDGSTMPQLGFGTSPLNDQQVEPLIVAAVEAGYRHIDTAYRYGNQVGVGRGIRASGIPREEIFVTTKLDGEFQGGERAVAGLDECLRQLNMDYVDLLLIHWPLPQRDEYVATWRSFEKLLAQGKTRSIGVSNFKPAHIDRLLAETDTCPSTNQIQLNPRITRPEQRAYNQARGIVTVAWSPLGAGKDGKELLQEPILVELAGKYGKTPAQIVLRWLIELDVVAIPRSSSPARVAENIDIFDFELAADDVATISGLHSSEGVDSDTSGH